jgi:hypothetical protein
MSAAKASPWEGAIQGNGFGLPFQVAIEPTSACTSSGMQTSIESTCSNPQGCPPLAHCKPHFPFPAVLRILRAVVRHNSHTATEQKTIRLKGNQMNATRATMALLAVTMLSACAGQDFKSSMDGAGGAAWKLFGFHDTEVKDESKYEQMPFEKVVNKAFAKQIGDKDFRFVARYKGTVPQPGEYKSVAGFVNIKLCHPEKPDVCSDLCIVKSDLADMLFSLKNDQIVHAFGFLQETTGMKTAGGTTVNWNQIAASSPYNFVRIIRLAPVKK